jgi:uncharacterized protein (TIGR02391 family)
LKYCRVELMQDNYFHSVFEAVKGLAQRIRDLSGVQLDGAALVDRVPVKEFGAQLSCRGSSGYRGRAPASQRA